MLDYPTLRTKDLGQEALSAKSAPSIVSDAKQDPPLSNSSATNASFRQAG